jgi:HEPN domain-containing protein
MAPEDPMAWLDRAFSNLRLARTTPEGVLFEDLCFEAQQAAEKAIKALLIFKDQEFPYVHDIGLLLEEVVRAGIPVPDSIWEATSLTQFAVVTRYPGVVGPVDRARYGKALSLAESVVHWVEAAFK